MTSPKFTPADAARLEEAALDISLLAITVPRLLPTDTMYLECYLEILGYVETDPSDVPGLLLCREGVSLEALRCIRDLLPFLLAAYRELEAENGRLRRALKPFRNELAIIEEVGHLEDHEEWTVEIGDIRHLCAVLKEAEQND